MKASTITITKGAHGLVAVCRLRHYNEKLVAFVEEIAKHLRADIDWCGNTNELYWVIRSDEDSSIGLMESGSRQ